MAAKTFKVAIPGDASLVDIQSAIAGEEALGTRFETAQVTTDAGEVVNLSTFTRLIQGPLPASPTLRAASTGAPPGKQKQWEGQMLVGSSLMKVVLYR